jgi:hypothetical protein
VNRHRRRAEVRLNAERILRDKGELGSAELCFKIDKLVRYDLNPQIVGQMLKGHPRIIRIQNTGSIASYRVTKLGNPQ